MIERLAQSRRPERVVDEDGHTVVVGDLGDFLTLGRLRRLPNSRSGRSRVLVDGLSVSVRVDARRRIALDAPAAAVLE